nr:immunoglobulin light chain junction region [Macaca mulatta]
CAVWEDSLSGYIF